MKEEIIIDARVLPPQVKHPTIIEQVKNLVPGEHMILINDHDPKPLYYQLHHLMGDVFAWEYVVSGIDDVWKVKIKKKLQFSKTVGQITTEYPSASTVFAKYKIDFCCNGNRDFEEVCKEKGLDPKAVLKEIKDSAPSRGTALRFDEWTSTVLCDFIENNHHKYIKKQAPRIEELLDKVYNVHGDSHPELEGIYNTFNELIDELYIHMEKEEIDYFPAVRKYENEGVAPDKKMLKEILMDEHAAAGEMLEEIRRLCNDYNAPADACASFELLYKMLEEFEEDLHQHIHLENNILFPRIEDPVKFKSCAVK